MRVLFCTVGGSATPVLTAVEKWAAARVVFVASGDDPVSKKPGSWTEVEVETWDGFPPNRTQRPPLPARAGLADGTWETLRVPADDAEQVADAIRAHAAALGPGAEVLIDYTGGTKSMSAGAYLAGNLLAGARCSVVTGPRQDLLRVADGTQRARLVGSGAVGRHVVERICSEAWSSFHYAEAVRALAALDTLDDQLERLRLASSALVAWDAGEHAEAGRLLSSVPGFLDPRQRRALGQLARGGDEAASWLAWDLYWMAERRHAAGRHDDAVLLLYRCTEHVAQWWLWRDHGVRTGNVGDRPEIADLCRDARQGTRVLGLVAAWTALARLGGPGASVAASLGGSLLRFVEFRNQSLYAHGTRPVSRDDAVSARAWFDQHLRPGLEVNGAPPFDQFPRGWGGAG